MNKYIKHEHVNMSKHYSPNKEHTFERHIRYVWLHYYGCAQIYWKKNLAEARTKEDSKLKKKKKECCLLT